MSVIQVHRVVLGCDKCGAVLEGDSTPTALRREAAEKGWCRSKAHQVDTCPNCPRPRRARVYKPSKRYPVGPLIEALRPQKGWDSTKHLVPAQPFSYADAGALFGITGDAMQHRAHRGLTPKLADEMAIKAGLHPADIWKDWWDD